MKTYIKFSLKGGAGMKTYIKFSLEDETGEADITAGSLREIEEWIKHQPLLAADWLKDVVGISSQLYDKALDQMQAGWAKAHGQ